MNRIWQLIGSTWTVASRLAEVTYRLVVMLTMLTFIGLIGTAAAAFLLRPELPERITLQIRLPGALADMSGVATVLSAFGGSPQTALFDLVDALHSAAADSRVRAVVAELGDGPFHLAQNQAIAAALATVRAAGKPTYVFTDSFGEMSPGYAAYHLASAFDQIWLQPVGQLAATGIALEARFYGELLEAFGVDPLFGFRKEYKTSQHHLLFASSTGPQAEMMAALAGDLQRQTTAEIAQGRKQPPERIQRNIDGAPYSDRQALALGLVDRLGYQDELVTLASEQHGELVPVLAYLRQTERRYVNSEAPSLGLVTIQGQIDRGSGTGANLLGGPMQGAASIARRIERLAEQERIAAIILRVDSPGGSPAAAETIHRAVTQAQAKGKPVIVSMAGVAGSGAYWLAAGADVIVAEPATLTGSIGVVGGKLDFSRLLTAMGITTEQRTAAAHAGMWSMSRGYQPDELTRRDQILDATYETFLERVSAGRGLEPKAVAQLAKGRVWTGRQALDLGLVDRLGGLEDAIVVARQHLALAPDSPVNLVRGGQLTGLPGLSDLVGSLLGQLASILRLELEIIKLRIVA